VLLSEKIMSIKEVELRQGNLDKVEIKRYFEENILMLSEMFERVGVDEFSQKLSANATHFCLYERSRLIGFMAGYFNQIDKGVAYISTISISGFYHDKGLGKRLLQSGIDYARKAEFNVLRLQVRRNNSIAIKFYKSFGFHKVETLKSSFILEKTLSNE